MHALRFLALLILPSFFHSKKYFYIYDWPEYMSDVWPPDNASLHVESPYMHDFRPNNGAGKCIMPDIGIVKDFITICSSTYLFLEAIFQLGNLLYIAM